MNRISACNRRVDFYGFGYCSFLCAFSLKKYRKTRNSTHPKKEEEREREVKVAQINKKNNVEFTKTNLTVFPSSIS